MNPFGPVFDRLDEWKAFPNYQLERRADIYFSLYLLEVLKERYGPLKPVFVPEFPVKKATTNRSVKIDYVAVTADGAEMILVELKTDPRSVRRKQIEYLLRTAEDGAALMISGIRSISKATKDPEKYEVLVEALGHMGLTGVPDRELPQSCRVVLIQPRPDLPEWAIEMIDTSEVEFDVIDFDEYCMTISKHKDDLSRRFVKSISKWRQADKK